MRELNFISAGNLKWLEKPEPDLEQSTDVIVRPFIASRCDGDGLPIHNKGVGKAMALGLNAGVIDPAVGHICGPIPFRGPFAIGHEAIGEVVALGADVTTLSVGDQVVIPWSISCGTCDNCQRGVTAKCTTSRVDGRTLAAYGFGPASGPYGGLVADAVRVPFADHMLVKIPQGLDPLRVAAASDNLSDAWRAVVPQLTDRPGASVLVVGGGAQSIGIYAAGLAMAHGAGLVTYTDRSHTRLTLAESLGATPMYAKRPEPVEPHDIVVEASSSARGLRAAIRSTAPGGFVTAVGYYVKTNTGTPLMHMYANDITLHIGVSSPRATMPNLLEWMAANDFAADRVTTLLADWDDAPRAYAASTTKVVLRRDPIHHPAQHRPAPPA